MKYRIIGSGAKDYPYMVQVKAGFFSRWKEVNSYADMERAERVIVRHHNENSNKPPKGHLIQSFEPQDLTALILKYNDDGDNS